MSSRFTECSCWHAEWSIAPAGYLESLEHGMALPGWKHSLFLEEWNKQGRFKDVTEAAIVDYSSSRFLSSYIITSAEFLFLFVASLSRRSLNNPGWLQTMMILLLQPPKWLPADHSTLLHWWIYWMCSLIILENTFNCWKIIQRSQEWTNKRAY